MRITVLRLILIGCGELDNVVKQVDIDISSPDLNSQMRYI